MTTHAKLMTAEELAQLPDDGRLYELVRGELRTMSPSGRKHGRIAARLAWRLGQYAEANGLGEIAIAEAGFLIARNPDTVLAPDVGFISTARAASASDNETFWPFAPDLAVEVVSPGDRPGEVKEKIRDWLGAGTRLVIIIEPRKQIVTVYRSLTEFTELTINDELTGGDVVPGWAMPVSALFAPPAAANEGQP
jgi:Uma2 family endonuclease